MDTHLTPEEDAIGDIFDEESEIDDMLPADLWFRCGFKRYGTDEPSPGSRRKAGENRRLPLN
jgi:hypothetical protein